MVPAMQNEYARADQACVWALLARIYLNAEVYTGTARYTDAITYANKVIAAGYTLLPKYQNLFLADNNLNNTEQLLSIAYDGQNTQNYGGTTFIINAAIGGKMTPATYGVPGGGWGGNRVTSNIPQSFPSSHRYHRLTVLLFFTNGQNETIDQIANFNDGLAVTKFQNVTSTGVTPTNASVYASTDFPLFRLGEIYLIYAEAVLRGGTGGTNAQAILYFNMLRERAYGNVSGNVTTLALQDILNERGRELYWECFRRTDLCVSEYLLQEVICGHGKVVFLQEQE